MLIKQTYFPCHSISVGEALTSESEVTSWWRGDINSSPETRKKGKNKYSTLTVKVNCVVTLKRKRLTDLLTNILKC